VPGGNPLLSPATCEEDNHSLMGNDFKADANGNLDPEAPPPSNYNYGRRRSRAVLYQLSGHYKTASSDNKSKKIHSKLSTNVSSELRGYYR